MKNWQFSVFIPLITAISIMLSACGSGSSDVVSLDATPIPLEKEEILDNETMMMEYTACLRGEGLEVSDPVVNADGLVGKPQIIEGTTKDEIGVAMEVCEHLLEGFTFERKREDFSQEIDKLVALASCLREEGIDIDDPTAETLDTWRGDLKSVVNFDDPSQVQIYETCSGTESGASGKK
jgi:hypothetical protein